jgi:hypothetical protein
MILGALLSGSCSHSSGPIGLRLDATAIVDGREVRASTLWTYETASAFPQGIQISVKGVALAIPIAKGRSVYGIFRVLDGHILRSWDEIPLQLTSYAIQEGKMSGKDDISQGSPRGRLRYSVKRLVDRKLEICRSATDGKPEQSICPVFIYFPDPSSSESPMRVSVGTVTGLGVHTIVIRNIYVTYSRKRGYHDSTVANLPTFLKPDKHEVFSRIPGDLTPILDTHLTTSDFLRTR